jgi:putative PEP-CTERM system TPR-repeat lipoprotein
MTRHRTLTTLAAALAAAALLQACGGPSDSELLASAKTYLDKKDPKAAIIQIKSALQNNPQSGEARYLLGKALLDTNDAVAASVELRKAEQAGFDPVRVSPALARSLLAQGEDRKVVDAYATVVLADKAATADLKTSVALAQARLGQRDAAQQSLTEALAAAPQFTQALLLQARLAAEKQDFTGALALLDQITTAEPGNAEAWLFKAEIQHIGTRDKPAALASYRKAAEARIELMAAHQGLVALLVDTGDIAGAEAHVAQLKAKLPQQPVTKMLEAQMAFLRKDYAATRELVTPLLQLAPNNALLLQLAGAAEYHLRALPQAENLLAQALKIAPGMPLAQQLLARTYLRTGLPEKALEVLQASIESAQPSAELLTLAGEAYLQTGDARRAEQMFSRATQVSPNQPRARTALALGQIGKGNTAAGLTELEAVAAADAGVTADMALLATHLRRSDFDKALKAIDAIERKQPANPMAANLRGRVLMLRNDTAGARKSFEAAVAIDPVYFPAVTSLAALDLTENKPDAARKRFADLLVADPKNYRAMLAMASMSARAGAPPQDVATQIEAAVKAAPGEAAPRLALVNHQLAAGNAKAALAAAQDGTTALPTSRELVNALGRAQIASGDYQQAVTSFNKLAGMQPNSPQAELGLADAFTGLKNYEEAEKSLKRALAITPTLLVAQRGLIGMMAGEGRYTDAIAVAREVQKQRPTEAVGYQMEGDIELQRRNFDAGLAAHRTALQKTRSSDAAVRLHVALLAANKPGDADSFAAAWLKDHANDVVFRFHLGDVALGRKDFALAESRYREVIKLQPENPLALNNVAWLMVKQGKPGALPLAEKASQAAPGQRALLDTLALAMAAEQQLPKAIELQKATVARWPDDPTLRLTLARLHLQANDKVQARGELEKLAQLGKKFPDHAEVAELLKGV